MSRTRTVLLTVSTIVACGGLSLPVAFLAERYPDFAGPIVLAGILIIGALLAVVGIRALREDRKGEFAVRLRQSELSFCLGCAVSALGGLISGIGRTIYEVIGIVLSFVGLCWVFLIVFRAVPGEP